MRVNSLLLCGFLGMEFSSSALQQGTCAELLVLPGRSGVYSESMPAWVPVPKASRSWAHTVRGEASSGPFASVFQEL